MGGGGGGEEGRGAGKLKTRKKINAIFLDFNSHTQQFCATETAKTTVEECFKYLI